MSRTGQQRGWTLVELLAVLVIVGIGISLGYPSYQRQLTESRRSEAHRLLMTAANAQQRWYSMHFSYVSELESLSIEGVKPHYYQLSLSHPACASEAPLECFILTATPQPGSPQHNDDKCPALTIDHLGRKAPQHCWP